MQNVSGNPFVIQFSNLDDFIAEIDEAEIGVVRVWLGQFGTGGSPGFLYHGVMVQAIDPAQTAILMTTLIIGSFETLNGRPFGPQAEASAEIIQNHLKQAESDVELYLKVKLPAIIVSPGHVFTGLNGPQFSRAYWPGFEAIYDALKKARGG